MVSVGTIVWLSSELMFFAALFAAYFTIRAVSPELWAQETEKLNVPFSSVNTIDPGAVLGDLPARRLRGRGRRRSAAPARLYQVKQWGLREWFVLTYIMGAIFIGGQAFEYAELVHEGVTIPSSAYGTVFYLATGFHGLHVTGGLVAFLFVLGPHLRRPQVHPRAGRDRHRRVLLLALRRRGLDRPVRHRLPHQVALTRKDALVRLTRDLSPDRRPSLRRAPQPRSRPRSCCSSRCS